ncbi:MAG: 4'-phosphopantetheinyl transferase superfamily protein [Gammaproteobacteria bacterium]
MIATELAHLLQPLSLKAGDLHIWLVFADFQYDAAPAAYEALLSPDEHERWQRFQRPETRRQFVISRALLRTTLSRYHDLPPHAWRFVTNRHGRPEIADPELSAALRFNLSHTDGLIALGVTGGHAIGVDVEYCARTGDLIGIAERFFSTQEYRDLLALPEDRHRDRFFDYWTLKESYIKARGMGLALPLGQFSFDLTAGNGSIRIAFTERIADEPARWRFWLSSPSPQHRIAVCVERDANAPTVIAMRAEALLG